MTIHDENVPFYPLGFCQRQARGGQSHCVWPGRCAFCLQLPPHQELPGLQGCCRSSRKVSFEVLICGLWKCTRSQRLRIPIAKPDGSLSRRVSSEFQPALPAARSAGRARRIAFPQVLTLCGWNLYRENSKSEMFCGGSAVCSSSVGRLYLSTTDIRVKVGNGSKINSSIADERGRKLSRGPQQCQTCFNLSWYAKLTKRHFNGNDFF